MGVDLLDQMKSKFKKEGYVFLKKEDVASILGIEQKIIDDGVSCFNEIIRNVGLVFSAEYKESGKGWGEIKNFKEYEWKSYENARKIIEIFNYLAIKIHPELKNNIILKKIDWVQLAFRKKGPAIDDFNAHLDGGGDYRSDPDARISRIAMIGGILLSDCENKESGATVVWPGSHEKMKKYCEKLENLSITDPRIAKYNFKNYLKKNCAGPDNFKKNALPITGHKGDFFFFHYATLHGTAENISKEIRKTLFHRFKFCKEELIDGRTKYSECLPDKIGKGDGMDIYKNLLPWSK